MDVDGILAGIVEELKPVRGLVAVALGGSRARGVHTPGSDADLGLYYDPATLDLEALRAAAARVDDAHRRDVLTEVGGWGPWIDGGGWLTVGGLPVDFLYRDISRVAAVVEDCRAGHYRAYYQAGHPYAFVSAIYVAEVALCRVLWDPTGALAALQALARPYPPALKAAFLAQA